MVRSRSSTAAVPPGHHGDRSRLLRGALVPPNRTLLSLQEVVEAHCRLEGCRRDDPRLPSPSVSYGRNTTQLARVSRDVARILSPRSSLPTEDRDGGTSTMPA